MALGTTLPSPVTLHFLLRVAGEGAPPPQQLAGAGRPLKYILMQILPSIPFKWCLGVAALAAMARGGGGQPRCCAQISPSSLLRAAAAAGL